MRLHAPTGAIRRLLCAGTALGVSATASHAQTDFKWDGELSALWKDNDGNVGKYATNWTPDRLATPIGPDLGDAVFFSSPSPNLMIDLQDDRFVRRAEFGGSDPYTLFGGALFLDTGEVFVTGPAMHAINGGLGFNIGGVGRLDVDPGSQLSVGGPVIAPAPALQIVGGGLVTLGSALNNQPQTTVIGSTLAISDPGALGPAGSALFLSNASTLITQASMVLPDPITLTGPNAIDVANAGQTTDLTGGILGTGSLSKIGPGTLALRGDNQHSSTSVINGTVSAYGPASLGKATAAPVSILSTARLMLNSAGGSQDYANPITLFGGGTIGAQDISDFVNIIAPITGDGTLTIVGRGLLIYGPFSGLAFDTPGPVHILGAALLIRGESLVIDRPLRMEDLDGHPSALGLAQGFSEYTIATPLTGFGRAFLSGALTFTGNVDGSFDGQVTLGNSSAVDLDPGTKLLPDTSSIVVADSKRLDVRGGIVPHVELTDPAQLNVDPGGEVGLALHSGFAGTVITVNGGRIGLIDTSASQDVGIGLVNSVQLSSGEIGEAVGRFIRATISGGSCGPLRLANASGSVFKGGIVERITAVNYDTITFEAARAFVNGADILAGVPIGGSVVVPNRSGELFNGVYADGTRFDRRLNPTATGAAGFEGDEFQNVSEILVVRVASTACPADLTTTGATLPGLEGFAVPDATADLDDLGYFLNLWLALDSLADFTTTGATIPGLAGYGEPDGNVDLDDLGYFLIFWLEGCP